MAQNQQQVDKMAVESPTAEGAGDWVNLVPEPHVTVHTIRAGESVVDTVFRNKPPEVIHPEDDKNSNKYPPNDCSLYNYRSHGKTLIIELKAGGDQNSIQRSSQEPDLIEW